MMAMMIIIIANIKLIHIGLNTQSQDQLILPKSLRTIKTICKAPVNPSPLEPELLEFELLAITYPP